MLAFAVLYIQRHKNLDGKPPLFAVHICPLKVVLPNFSNHYRLSLAKISDKENQDLIRQSVKVREFAYSPYSGFKVGAALRCENGTIYTGCNVENSSFTPSICAERTAIVKAVSEGHKNFTAVSVSADKIKGHITSPCGVCRQSLKEFCEPNVIIFMSTPDTKEVQVITMDELLPYGFKFSQEDVN